MEYQQAIFDENPAPIMSTIDTLIPQEYTVQQVFGFPSQIKIQGFAPGHPLVPKKIDGYVWDVKMVRDCVEWLNEENPDPVWLSGETGTGKTAFWQNLFAGLNIPAVFVSAKSSTEPDDILGRTHLRDGNTVFVPGELLQAYQKGYAIIFDEVDAYNPEVMMACHRLLERAVITLDDGTIVTPAPKIYMAATANTRGDGQGSDLYVATNISNMATMNRFEHWRMTYPEPSVEINILKNAFGGNLQDSIIEAMVATAGDIRVAYSNGSCPGPISIRQLLRWGRKLIQAWSRKDVAPIYHSFDKSMGNGVDDHVRQMLHTLIQTRFGVAAPAITGITP